MAKNIEGLTRVLRLRPEIVSLIRGGRLEDIREFDPSPSLADVVSYYEFKDLCVNEDLLPRYVREKCRSSVNLTERARIFVDPHEFFARTFLTESMDDLIVKIFAGLLGGEATRRDGTVTTLRSRIIILPSLMGGGKTHLLITIYHLLRLYNVFVVERKDLEAFRREVELLNPDLASRLYNIVANPANSPPKPVRIAAIDGMSEESAPDPNMEEPAVKVEIVKSGSGSEVRSYTVRTLWGALAYYLGGYSILSKRDESNTVPSKEELKRLLEGSPFLIMIDEPLVYASRYGDLEKLRDFFQVLAVALKEVGNGILILSIPVAREELGSSRSGSARAIYEVLARTEQSMEIIPPLKSPEIIHVLKKRLFENGEEELRHIGKEVAKLFISKGGDIVKSAVISAYGSVAAFEDKISESYPFSPAYLELLEDFFNNLRYLQRTRDAIRITIMSMAAIFNGYYRRIAGDFYLIAPYHIPVQDPSVRSYLVNPNSDDYQILMSMYDKDVEEASRKISRPWLAKIIATFIWLRSIIGRGIPEKQYLRLYPSRGDIVLATFDPAVFSQHNIGVGVVGDVLEELYSYSNYMVFLDNKYFMTQLLPIDELIKRKIRDVSDIAAHKKLCDLAKELFIQSPKSKKKGKTHESRVFKEVHVICIENSEFIPDLVEKGDEPVLLVYVYEPDEEEVNSVLVRNNVVVVTPSLNTEIDDPEAGRIKAEERLLSLAKELAAIENIDKNELKKLYGDEFAEAKFKQLGNRAGEIRKKIANLYRNQVYNMIVVGKPRWTIRQAIGSVMQGVEESAVRAVEEILIDKSHIPPNYALSKEDIVYIAKKLGKVCVDELSGLETFCDEVEIEELWRWFITTLEPPLKSTVVDFNGFIEGIKQLYEDDLAVAFSYGENYVWKKIRKEKPINANDQGDWADVEDLAKRIGIDVKRLKIVPWTSILERFISDLRKLEGVKRDGKAKKLVKVMVSYTDVFGERVDEELTTFLQKDGWRQMTRTAVFWQVVEYPEYIFSVDIERVKVNGEDTEYSEGLRIEPGSKVTITLVVDAKEYPFPITLEALRGEELVEQRRIKGDGIEKQVFEIVFQIPGEHKVIFEAIGEDPKGFSIKREIIVKVSGEIPEELEVGLDGLKTILDASTYSKVTLRYLKVSEVGRLLDLIREFRLLRGLPIDSIELNALSIKGTKSDKTSLTIGPGVFGSFDEFRAFTESLSRSFRLEAGSVTVRFDNLNDRQLILRVAEATEKAGIQSSLFGVVVFRKVG